MPRRSWRSTHPTAGAASWAVLEFGTLAGFTLAATVVLVVELVIGSTAMQDWGWRIPFLLGGPLGLVGLYLRSRLEDTPVFRELEEQDQVEDAATSALKDLLTSYGSRCSPSAAWSSR